MKLITIGILSILMSACATTPIYQPIPDGYVGGTATIHDSYSNKESTTAHFFILEKMEDTYMINTWNKTRNDHHGQGTWFIPSTVTRNVLLVQKKYKILGLVFFPTDAQMIFGDDMRVTKEFLFTPKAGEIYTVKGRLSEASSSVWLENSSGEIVENSLGKSK